MTIESRTVGAFIEVKITIGAVTHDLGLYEREEAFTLASQLQDGATELSERAEVLPKLKQ